MSERRPTGQPEPEGTTHPWHPGENVGDIYSIDIGTNGEISDVTRLADHTDSEATAETSGVDEPRVWVGSWSDYNNGVLHGRWIATAREEAEMWADIQGMLAESPTAARTGEPAEEWGIFDYDNFHGLRIGEQESISYVVRIARGITQHGPAFAAYANVMQDEGALDSFEDDFLGRYDSLEDYVEQLCDDLGYTALLDQHIGEGIRSYIDIDYGGLGRDMVAAGDIHAIDANSGGVWIFCAH